MASYDPDDDLLASYDAKLQLIRDRVRGVADGYLTGFYLWGAGGTAKSHTVDATLTALGRPYVLTNSRITAKGLFGLFEEAPDAVHVLEDVETVLSDKPAYGVLRSVLWALPGHERVAVWQTADGREEVVFTGGVILVANAPLGNAPELQAIKTRIPVLHFEPTDREVAALMRRLARNGHTHLGSALTPEICGEVARVVVERAAKVGRRLDLRLYVNACQDRLQWEDGASETDWLTLLETRLTERAMPGHCPTGIRALRTNSELDIACRITDLPPKERLAAWVKETGKSRAALYRRLEQLSAQ